MFQARLRRCLFKSESKTFQTFETFESHQRVKRRPRSSALLLHWREWQQTHPASMAFSNHTHTDNYTRTDIHTHTDNRTHTDMHTHTDNRTHTDIHTHTSTQTDTHRHTSTHAHTDTHRESYFAERYVNKVPFSGDCTVA